MGSKINKKIFLFFIFCCLLFVNTSPCFASKFVRVAISTNNFRSYAYNEVSVIATSDFALYDKTTALPIAKFLPTDIVKVKLTNGSYEIFVNDKSITKDITTTLIFDCPNGVLGVKDLKRKSKQALYHGIFEIDMHNENTFYLVNVLDLQEYLKGVVPNEMPVSFGLEALKAQAVAARNYVLMPRVKAHKEFDVDDSVASQVYYGANTESPIATQAVQETMGLVALHNWELILAQYCSTAGGYTEDFQNAFSDPRSKSFPANPKPYLKGRADMFSQTPLTNEDDARMFYMTRPDSFDMQSPYYRWTKEFSVTELQDVLKKTLVSQSATGFVTPKFEKGDNLGTLKEIRVLRRGVSGKVMALEIVTDKGIWIVQKELVIRRIFQKNNVSLPSANIVFDPVLDEKSNLTGFIIYGGGFGHGVGMSQFGAGFMGKNLNKSFDKILKRYYSGISITTMPVTVSGQLCQRYFKDEFYAPSNRAFLVLNNPFKIKSFGVKINGVDISAKLYLAPCITERYGRIDISDFVHQGKNTIEYTSSLVDKSKYVKLYVELIGKDDSEYSF